MTPPSPDPEPVAAEPLTLENLGERLSLLPRFATSTGDYVDVENVLDEWRMTLDAARSAPPITATAIEERAAVMEGWAVDPQLKPATRWLSLSVALAILRGMHPALAALPVREDGPTGIDVERLARALAEAEVGCMGFGGLHDDNDADYHHARDAKAVAAEYDRPTRKASHGR